MIEFDKMTECERIIEQGILPESFFKEEMICDFLVDGNRKKLWAVCLDLLIELDEVCKKHHLRYCLSGGSLLGAVRHHGFIPWDDDIDVVMPREDYDRLSQYVDDFQSPYFYQTPFTDPGYFISYNKLRNVNTSGVSVVFQYEGFCQGIGIDIFPLDKFKKEGMRDKYDKLRELTMDLGTYMRMSNPELDEKNKKRVASYSGRDPMDTYRMMEEVFFEDRDEVCDYIGLLSCTSYDIERLSWDMGDYDDLIDGIFCGLKIPIPKLYDKVLRVQYGDYWELPPVEKRGAWHSGVIFDAEKPYTEYLKRK